MIIRCLFSGLLFLFFFLSGTQSQAQIKRSQKVPAAYCKVMINPWYAWQHYESMHQLYLADNVLSLNKMRTICTPGFFFEYDKGGHSSFEAGILVGMYTKMKSFGYKEVLTIDSFFFSHIETMLRLSYLQLPLTYKYSFGKRKLNFIAEIGLYFNYLLSLKISYENFTTGYASSYTIKDVLLLEAGMNPQPFRKRIFWGPTIGFGLRYKHGHHQFAAGIGYLPGPIFLIRIPESNIFPDYMAFFRLSYGIDIFKLR